MGGDGQPQTHLAVISNILDFDMNIQEAIESPRWIHGSAMRDNTKMEFNVEARVPESVIDQLNKKGHQMNILDDWSWNVGHAQGILIDPETHIYQGGADPRGDGYAIGW